MYVVKMTSAGHSSLKLLPSYIWSLDSGDDGIMGVALDTMNGNKIPRQILLRKERLEEVI